MACFPLGAASTLPFMFAKAGEGLSHACHTVLCYSDEMQKQPPGQLQSQPSRGAKSLSPDLGAAGYIMHPSGGRLTRSHRLGLQRLTLGPQSSGDWKSEVKGWAGLESVDGSLPGWQTGFLTMSLHDLPSVRVLCRSLPLPCDLI